MCFLLFFAWLAPASPVLGLTTHVQKGLSSLPDSNYVTPLLFLIASCLFPIKCLSFIAIYKFLFLIKRLFRAVRKFCTEGTVICQHNTQFPLLLPSCIPMGAFVTIDEAIFDTLLLIKVHSFH